MRVSCTGAFAVDTALNRNTHCWFRVITAGLVSWKSSATLPWSTGAWGRTSSERLVDSWRFDTSSCAVRPPLGTDAIVGSWNISTVSEDPASSVQSRPSTDALAAPTEKSNPLPVTTTVSPTRGEMGFTARMTGARVAVPGPTASSRSNLALRSLTTLMRWL